MSMMIRPLCLVFGLGLACCLSVCGCARNPYATNPFAAQGYGSPWTTPPAASGVPPVTLPPPQAQNGPLPAVPALPPAGTAPSPTVPPATSGAALRDWSNPGTLSQQQQRATMFDPYADNNAGPEIVGGRPREFQKPLAEPVRARGFRDTRWPF